MMKRCGFLFDYSRKKKYNIKRYNFVRFSEENAKIDVDRITKSSNRTPKHCKQGIDKESVILHEEILSNHFRNPF